jgi:hypothetical protein
MPTMNLSTPGAFCFLDTVPGAELSPLVRKVERLGYSVLWYVEGTGRESLSLGTYLLSADGAAGGGERNRGGVLP